MALDPCYAEELKVLDDRQTSSLLLARKDASGYGTEQALSEFSVSTDNVGLRHKQRIVAWDGTRVELIALGAQEEFKKASEALHSDL